MPTVRVPDGRLVKFPDDMPREQIKGIIAEKFPESVNVNTPQIRPMTPEQREQARLDAEKMREGLNYQSVPMGAITGTLEGLASGVGRVASGASLGATDWLDRKTGGYLANLDKEIAQNAESAGLGGVNDVARFLAETGGVAKGAGNLIMKGAKTIPSMIGKGAIEGGIYGATSSDKLEELPQNIYGGSITGAGAAGVLGLAGRGLQRLIPALNAEGKAKNLQDAFMDKESTKALKRGAMASEEISDRLASEMPAVKDNINLKMNNIVDDVIGERPNIEEMVGLAKQEYGNYASQNSSNPVNIQKIFKDYGKYTQVQKDAIEDAINSANRETNSALGTVEHTHQMRMAIDDMIDAASKGSKRRQLPALGKLRNAIDNVLKTDEGYKAIDNKYSEVMGIKNAYDLGKSASKKTQAPKFKNEMERRAWLSGVNETMQDNLINSEKNYAKSVSNNLSILKKGLNNEEIGLLKKASNSINKEYSRANSLDRVVNKETYGENLPFWREVIESVGSAVGSTIGGAEKALYGMSDRATANRILQGISDSKIAKNINRNINRTVPSISAVFAKRMADYEGE